MIYKLMKQDTFVRWRQKRRLDFEPSLPSRHALSSGEPSRHASLPSRHALSRGENPRSVPLEVSTATEVPLKVSTATEVSKVKDAPSGTDDDGHTTVPVAPSSDISTDNGGQQISSAPMLTV